MFSNRRRTAESQDDSGIMNGHSQDMKSDSFPRSQTRKDTPEYISMSMVDLRKAAAAAAPSDREPVAASNRLKDPIDHDNNTSRELVYNVKNSIFEPKPTANQTESSFSTSPTPRYFSKLNVNIKSKD